MHARARESAHAAPTRSRDGQQTLCGGPKYGLCTRARERERNHSLYGFDCRRRRPLERGYLPTLARLRSDDTPRCARPLASKEMPARIGCGAPRASRSAACADATRRAPRGTPRARTLRPSTSPPAAAAGGFRTRESWSLIVLAPVSRSSAPTRTGSPRLPLRLASSCPRCRVLFYRPEQGGAFLILSLLLLHDKKSRIPNR